MLLDFKNLIKKYNMRITGVIHIGAHYGQEHSLYEDESITNIVYFEPLSKNYKILKENVGDKSVIFNYALGNEDKKIMMYVESANQGMSSSILKPKIHVDQYPHIVFNNTEEVEMKKLDEIDLNFSKFNLINIDVQGYELEVFKGAEKTLNSIDYIISEINRDEVYENCAKVEEVDIFLSQFSFERVETNWAGYTWGDALYVKNKK
jgi:FkbM family methyltransferase